MKEIEKKMLDALMCPVCKCADLDYNVSEMKLTCKGCAKVYEVSEDGTPNMIVDLSQQKEG